MSGDELLASLSQLRQKSHADSSRFLRIVLETVEPVGVVEADRKYGIAGKRQAVTARCHTNYTVTGRMAAGALDDHAWRDLMLLIERPQMAPVFCHETLGGCPKSVRESLRHVSVGEVGRLPKGDLGGCHVNLQIWPQPVLHTFYKEATDMVHVQMGQHNVSYRPKINAR